MRPKIATFGMGALLAAALFPTIGGPANDAEAAPGSLFLSNEPLEITIEAELSELKKDREQEEGYRPARIVYADEAGTEVAHEVRIKTRGRFRLQKSTCDFPPLKINLKKDEVAGTLFEGQDKLKLVTHCRTGRREYEQYVLQEYLAYRSLNTLTPYSFRVRLARITYVDVKKPDDRFTRFAFFIEDDAAMAERNDAIALDINGMPQRATSAVETTTMSVFQYMIGNTDWSVPGLHNIQLIQLKGRAAVIPVPFDFDFSGIVDTRYAAPSPHLKISSVRERLFRGVCRSEEELRPVLEQFVALKESILQLYADLEPLDAQGRRHSLDYLNTFFDTIENPRAVQSELLDSCRDLS